MQKYSTCPKCSHTRKKSKDKCLSTNTETGGFFCHHPHCDYKGNLNTAETFVAKRKKDLGGFSNTYDLDRVTTSLGPLNGELPKKVLEFFNARGITQKVLARNQVGFENNAIAFPFFKNGEIVNFKYRTLDKQFRQESGAEKIFYGLDDIQGQDTAIIVEGEIDKLALEEAGFLNVLSVPDGAPAPNTKSYESKFSYVENCEKELTGIKKIVLAVDNDGPGQKLESELSRRLGPEKCWTVNWPDGCKDANDTLVKHSSAELAKVIGDAQSIPISGLFTADDFFDDLVTLYEDGNKGGESTGWLTLDKYYTIKPGQMSIVTGIPSHGKSEFVDALIVNLARENDWRFALFSPENHPVSTHIAKLIQKYAGRPFGKQYRGHMSRSEMLQVEPWVNEHFYFIAPPDDELTVDHITSKARVAVMRYGIKGMVLDPWNEIDHSRSSGKTETEYISECLTKIRRFARAYGVHVWLVAHPTKLTKDKNGKYPIPTPYDIAGSAHFRNKADNGVCVWRDVLDEAKSVEIHVQKVRFREVGKPGLSKLKYDLFSGRYEDVLV